MIQGQLQTLSSNVFLEKKKVAIDNQPLRKKVYLSQIKLVDDDFIDMDGLVVRISEQAFDDFRAMLKIPKSFIKRFGDTFTEQGKHQFMNRLKDALAARTSDLVTLIANPKEKILLRILGKGKGGLSNEGFIDYFERIIDQWDLEVIEFLINSNGEFHIDTVSPAHIAKIHQINDEDFYPGISAQNTLNYSAEICPYVHRIICANGLSAREFEEKFRLHDLNIESIRKFNEQMRHFYNVNQLVPQGYIDKVYSAMRIKASVYEMQIAEQLLTEDTLVSHHEAQKFIKTENVTNKYLNHGIMPIDKMSVIQMKNAPTDISVWELINALTYFASHDHGYRLNEDKIMQITNQAGKMLLKKQFDMENRIPSPFDN